MMPDASAARLLPIRAHDAPTDTPKAPDDVQNTPSTHHIKVRDEDGAGHQGLCAKEGGADGGAFGVLLAPGDP